MVSSVVRGAVRDIVVGVVRGVAHWKLVSSIGHPQVMGVVRGVVRINPQW